MLWRFQKEWHEWNGKLYEEYASQGFSHDRHDMFYQLSKHIHLHSVSFDLEELIQTVNEVLLTNVDVTYTAIAFMIEDLARYPHYQHQIYLELVEASLFSDDISTDQYLQILHKSELLNMFALESCRMRPIVAFAFPERTVKPTTDLCGFKIPAGVAVTVDGQSLGMNEEVWGDASQFRPERFKSGKIPPFSLLQFGLGPRKCMGNRLAKIMINVTIAKLLEKYEIELYDKNSTPKFKTSGVPFFTPYLPNDVVFKPRE
eukprot:CAMPEP_0174277490 /NCGR_PEP_ID=MMETSP0439-20130205/60960_1 /TAXON_ID=0 /ORGANISM="Stereomyxa ramosa, Strain Chinc5" /LENGTH=258 /DNA_ID=CAMNT_0015369815 /DNA_START=638 /DNA_END=1414 /DNA_ORIENTATION=-